MRETRKEAKKSVSANAGQAIPKRILLAEVNAQTAALCGDFNNWATDTHLMKRLKNGSFSTTVSIPSCRSYRFRYLLDWERWENDWEADAYTPNEYGKDDSVVEV